jgi:hypothetical protein
VVTGDSGLRRDVMMLQVLDVLLLYAAAYLYIIRIHREDSTTSSVNRCSECEMANHCEFFRGCGWENKGSSGPERPSSWLIGFAVRTRTGSSSRYDVLMHSFCTDYRKSVGLSSM